MFFFIIKLRHFVFINNISIKNYTENIILSFFCFGNLIFKIFFNIKEFEILFLYDFVNSRGLAGKYLNLFNLKFNSLYFWGF